jgi:CRISPR/Cas system CSM-associated protein Csm2 small subunit
MAEGNTSDEQAQQQEQNLQLREALNNAYGFIEGQRSIQTFSTVTFEELMDQQIERLVGADTDSRPNAFNRITKIKESVVKAVQKIKELPDNAFAESDPDTDVNPPA